MQKQDECNFFFFKKHTFNIVKRMKLLFLHGKFLLQKKLTIGNRDCHTRIVQKNWYSKRIISQDEEMNVLRRNAKAIMQRIINNNSSPNLSHSQVLNITHGSKKVSIQCFLVCWRNYVVVWRNTWKIVRGPMKSKASQLMTNFFLVANYETNHIKNAVHNKCKASFLV
jgi:bacterioferritin (cytochrome b1)